MHASRGNMGNDSNETQEGYALIYAITWLRFMVTKEIYITNKISIYHITNSLIRHNLTKHEVYITQTFSHTRL